MSRNYANPFNPSTNISYTLPKDSDERVGIYNVLVEEIIEIINSNFTSGIHSITIEASSLSSGIYLFILIERKFIETKGMLLIK